MFYTGGHGGQRGLFGVPGWQSMPLWAAAQAVQVSAFPTAYAKWERTRTTVVGHSSAGGAQPLAPPKPARTIAAARSGLRGGPAGPSTGRTTRRRRPRRRAGCCRSRRELHADLAVRLAYAPDPARLELHTGRTWAHRMGTRVYAAAGAG